MKKKFKPMTAREYIALRESNPEWVKKNAERERKRKEAVQKRLNAIKHEREPLLADLIAADIRVRMNPSMQLTLPVEDRPGDEPVLVKSVSDLADTSDSYPEAVPILIKHFRNIRHPIMIDSVTRALICPESIGTEAPRLILEKLKSMRPGLHSTIDEDDARWVLAYALTSLSDENMEQELKDLISDESFAEIKPMLKKAYRNASKKRSFLKTLLGKLF